MIWSGRFRARSNSHSVAVCGGCTKIPLATVVAQEDETILENGVEAKPSVGSSTWIRQD